QAAPRPDLQRRGAERGTGFAGHAQPRHVPGLMAADPAYLSLLEGMADLHRRKSAGYSGADNPDPWANFRRAERLGIRPSVGAMLRLEDKVSRVESLMADAANEQVGESIEETLIDLAAYALIVVCLRRE